MLAGTVKLVGTDSEVITREIAVLLEDEAVYRQMSCGHNPYGDGTASTKIIEKMIYYHNSRQA